MKLIRHDGGKRHPLTLREYMDRFFDDPFMADPFGLFDLHPALPQHGRGVCVPKIDVSEDAKEIKIVADIPGYKPEDVEIEMKDGGIILKGKMKEEKMEEGEHFFHRERATGEFYREIPLPPNVDAEKAAGKIKNGTLTITLPKTEEKEKKTLKIKVED